MIQRRKEKEEVSRSVEEVEGRNIVKSIFEHDQDHGGVTSIVMGIPGSAKTAVCCSFADYIMDYYPKEKVWFRNSMYSPVQFVKLRNPHQIYIEEGSGVRLFDRFKGNDITEEMEVVYFNNFDDLYNKSLTGSCNAVFFGNSDMKGIPPDVDMGTIKWMGFIRYLLSKHLWQHVLIDEYSELAGARPSGVLWNVIESHSHDVKNARKSNMNIYANTHQTADIDFRIMQSIMVIVFLYGAHPYRFSRVNKHALDNLPKPTHRTGTYGWLSHGSKFGRVHFPTVYKPVKNVSFEARFTNE